jgi:spermidine synthase
MALCIVWLFAFQNLYGYVYQRIGWIVALFMGGLVLGSGWCQASSRRVREPDARRRHLWSRLIAADAALALLALAAPVLLPALGDLRASATNMALVEWSVSALVAMTGVLGGATFALGGSLHVELTGCVGTTASVIDAADHAGACLGALLCGILLVPVLGTVTAACLLAGVKGGSAVLLVLAWRLRETRPAEPGC